MAILNLHEDYGEPGRGQLVAPLTAEQRRELDELKAKKIRLHGIPK
jgi:hypothetical protein